MTPQARGIVLGLALSAAASREARPAEIPGRSAPATESWGSTEGHTTVMGYELEPMNPAGNVWYFRSVATSWCIQGTVGSEGAAPLDVPDGASLTKMEFWAYDVDAVNWLEFDVFEACQDPGAAGDPVETLLGTAETFGSAGTYYGSASLGGHTVDNSRCHYSVRVNYVPPGTACVADALQVNKVRVSWVRQVSPAPAAAAFNDVPTGHPFFQFVEALAKSGITAGCGGGAFCPDQPLTRGQMAVFLAKALGLWSEE
jgi:hypothetical protein